MIKFKLLISPGNVDILKLLIDNGADVNVKSVLHVATTYGKKLHHCMEEIV